VECFCGANLDDITETMALRIQTTCLFRAKLSLIDPYEWNAMLFWKIPGDGVVPATRELRVRAACPGQVNPSGSGYHSHNKKQTE
jgi:hypothetical protein